MQRKLILMLLLTMAIAGCDAFDFISEMLEKQETIQHEFSKRHGLDVIVGWNTNNGVLVQVEIAFKRSQVNDATVQQLTEIATPIILRHFDETPQTIIIQVLIDPDEQLIEGDLDI